MIYAWFYIRWQIARGLICVAMFVAPKGPARDLLWSHLRRFSIEVLSAITVMKPDPLSPANIEAVARAYCRRMGMDPDAESLRQTGCITMI